MKKQDVFIDKVQVGTVIKSKDSLSKIFTYKNMDGTTLATYATRFVASPIEGVDDDGYFYSEISFPEYDIVHGIDFEKESVSFPTQTRKSFVKSLSKKGYIGEDGKVIESSVKGDFSGPAVPRLITAYLEVEEGQKENLDYIHKRDKSKSILLVKGKSEQVNRQYLHNVGFSSFFFDDYKIKQGDVVIVTVKVRYNVALGDASANSGLRRDSDPKIYFFNLKEFSEACLVGK